MKKVSVAASVLLSSVLLFSSCETLEDVCGYSAEDLGFTEDYNQQLNAGIYLYQQADRCLRDTTLVQGGPAVMIDGASVTYTNQDSIIVDYGLGSVGEDGKVRMGSIRIYKVGDYRTPGSTANLVLREYAESDLHFESDLTITNTTPSPTSNPQYSLNLASLTLDSLELSGNLTADWTSGFTTASTADDEISLMGAATLTNTNSTDNFVGTINAPLEVSMACDYTFVSGEIGIVPSKEGLPFVSMDFISGDCANLFNATIDCQGTNLSFSYPIK